MNEIISTLINLALILLGSGFVGAIIVVIIQWHLYNS